MIKRRDRLFVGLISVSVILLVTLPFAFAALTGDEEHVFGGFLLNPIDGNTYLSKMYQGSLGNWLFKLPYTDQPGDGAYLNLFYLGLGHISRIFGVQILTVFHLARTLGCVFLLFTIWNFFGAFFIPPRPRKIAFALASLGSGMGWLVLSTGKFTSDFWVAETYPFLSAYANPHFPIGLAIVLWMVKPPYHQIVGWKSWTLYAIGAITISVINPFGIVITLVVLGGNYFWNLAEKSNHAPILNRIIIFTIFGCPLLFYDLWVANTDPAFMGWNSQNLTPSPPVWDLVLSLSPALFFGVVGLFPYRKMRNEHAFLQIRPLVIWSVLGIILVYLPVGLQRRFMMGLYIPIAGLAAIGIQSLGDKPRRFGFLTLCIFLLALPTNLVILLIAQNGIINRDPAIFLSKSEFQALDWLETNTEPEALVLSSPDMGLFIPAYTGRRVIYGHPFETVNAEEEEALVLQFFQVNDSEFRADEFLINREVDYIFYGPRENLLGEIHTSKDLLAVFTNEDVSIYKIPDEIWP
jgi:hypothetical protein